MKRSFSLKFNSHDITVVCISLILVVAMLIVSNRILLSYNSSDLVVNVYVQNKKIDQYTTKITDLKDGEEKIIFLPKSEFSSLIADMEILVNKQKGIKVEKEESPRKICSKQGWVNTPGIPIVCLPNKVMVIIEGSSPDQPIVIG